MRQLNAKDGQFEYKMMKYRFIEVQLTVTKLGHIFSFDVHFVAEKVAFEVVVLESKRQGAAVRIAQIAGVVFPSYCLVLHASVVKAGDGSRPTESLFRVQIFVLNLFIVSGPKRESK